MTVEDPTREPFGERLQQAAIQAEFDTGRREATLQRARTNVLLRLARMTAGSVVLVLGLAMVVLPGPGWLAVAAGLAILSRDVAWADRLLRYVRRRIPGIPADGRIPRSTMVTASLMATAGIALSLWWYLR
jgi:uncharacterized protein (TIGR02611 family)